VARGPRTELLGVAVQTAIVRSFAANGLLTMPPPTLAELLGE
jgi:hypothetical protein